jgi:hypothetical protein
VTLSELEKAMQSRGLRCVNIGHGSNGYGANVSTRLDDPTGTAHGFQCYFGHDLTETMKRALSNGPQLPPENDLDDEALDLL